MQGIIARGDTGQAGITDDCVLAAGWQGSPSGRTRSLEDHVFFACGRVEGTRFWFPMFAFGEHGEPKKRKRTTLPKAKSMG